MIFLLRNSRGGCETYCQTNRQKFKFEDFDCFAILGCIEKKLNSVQPHLPEIFEQASIVTGFQDIGP
ncbi:hypothetical protein HYN24_08690 [Dechloromonas sp. HYN0024]|nr:hypothetical protein HYN24_08690 [Dechloromonas sp. HYN0024]